MDMQIVTEHGHQVEFNAEKHVYIHNNNYVVGMSTILGKLASPMLENWKIANQVNAIKKEMERHGIPIDKIETIILNAKTNAKKQGDSILNIGSMVHKFCEMWLKGEKFTEPSDPVVKACFDKFKKFWKKHKLKLVESEKILYSERGYCGTLDLVAIDPKGNLWLIDIKTSKGIFINMVHQVHGYKLAYEEQTGKKINKMYIVRLPKDNGDFEARHILYKKEHLKAFLGLLSCHKSELLFNEQVRKYNQLVRRK
jgi:CRISPR/Cas system-associated exonuclease Cas4 (RecB family)